VLSVELISHLPVSIKLPFQGQAKMKNKTDTKLVERFLDAHGKMVILLQNPLATHTPFFTPDYKKSVQYWESWLRFGELGIIDAVEAQKVEAVLKLCREKWQLSHKSGGKS
jgi:hypothetical protein